MDPIPRKNDLPESSTVVPAPAIAINEFVVLTGNANKENPLSPEQKRSLENLCKQYLNVGDGQHTQSESEKRTDELLDLALMFWLDGNNYVAAEIMRAVYPYARVYYGHVEAEKNYYINSQDNGSFFESIINSQDKDAFFESITIRADRGCKVAQYAVGKRLFENKDYVQAAEYLQKSNEKGYAPAAKALGQMPAANQMQLAESTSNSLKPIPFREEREKLEKRLKNQLEENERSEISFQLGMLWYRQSPRDDFANARKECEKYLTLAAAKNNKDAAYQLCVLYETNFFDPPNRSAFYRQRALELKHPVAMLENDAKGNPEKLFKLYEFYDGKEYEGFGVVPDTNKAAWYLLSAADLGHPVALNMVIDLINENKLNLPSDRLESYKELFCKTATAEKSSAYAYAVVTKKVGRKELAAQLFLQAAKEEPEAQPSQQAANERKEEREKAMIELGQFCDAAHDANGAIRRYLLKKVSEGNVHAMIGLGDSFRKNKESEKAMKYYKDALAKNDETTKNEDIKNLIHMNIGRLYDDQYQNTRFFGKDNLRDNAIKYYELSQRAEVKMALLLLKAERDDQGARLEAAIFLSSTAPFNQGPAYKSKIESYLLSALATGYLVEASIILFKLHEKHFFPEDRRSDSDRWANLYLRKITEAADFSGDDSKLNELKLKAIQALIQLASAEPPHRLFPKELIDQYKPAMRSV